jgi:hypothetical protein
MTAAILGHGELLLQLIDRSLITGELLGQVRVYGKRLVQLRSLLLVMEIEADGNAGYCKE